MTLEVKSKHVEAKSGVAYRDIKRCCPGDVVLQRRVDPSWNAAQVVPTTYVDKHNRTISSNQYSVTEHYKPVRNPDGPQSQLPGVFFFYDLSPIKVRPPSANTMRC